MTNTKRKELKKILRDFFEEKNVSPPITGRKLEKAGHNKTEFLLELKNRLSEFESEPIIADYLDACEKLL